VSSALFTFSNQCPAIPTKAVMNNPTIYNDAVTSVASDTSTVILQRILGALKNVGAESQNLGAASGLKTNVTSIAANAARKSITIQNVDGSVVLLIKLGVGASATDYHASLASEAGAGTGGTLTLSSYTGSLSFFNTANHFTVLELE